MQLATVTEIITHFVGLMRVEVDPLRIWSHPDGAPHPHAFDYDGSGSPHRHVAPEAPQPAPSVTYLIPALDSHSDGHFSRWTGSIHNLPQAAPPPLADIAPPLPMENYPLSGGFGDSPASSSTVTVRWYGPDQTVIDDHQVNMLNGDTGYVDYLAGPLPFASDANVEPLIQQAYATIPATAPQLGYSESQELPLIKAFEDGLANGQSPLVASLPSGTSVDGVLTGSDGVPIAVSLPITTFDGSLPTANNVPFGQTIELGHDTAANAAVIIDTSAAPLTEIVQGNAYTANLIVQTNVVQADDQLTASGAPSHAGAPSLATMVGANSVHSTATFEDLPNVIQGTVTGSLGQTLTVNVVNGNFYDVNAVTQQNVLLNNTLYVGTPSVDHYYAVLGGNSQENALSITHDGPTYDIVIVLGNSYQANAIYQENVLSSNNQIGVAFSPTNAATDTLSTGGNDVTNQASIASIGADGWQTAGSGLEAFVKSLVADGDAAKLFPGLPAYGANVAVTIVTGDYYQLNLISQTNVVANSARALADLTKADGGAPATVIAGVDTLQNAAAIVAAHALDTQYVAGKAYETSLLLQTNIVDAHAVTSTTSSPADTVPDLVAFLNSANVADVGTAHTTLPTPDVHHPTLA